MDLRKALDLTIEDELGFHGDELINAKEREKALEILKALRGLRISRAIAILNTVSKTIMLCEVNLD